MLRIRRRSTPKNLTASPGPLSAWHAGRTSGLRQKAIQTDLRAPGRSGIVRRSDRRAGPGGLRHVPDDQHARWRRPARSGRWARGREAEVVAVVAIVADIDAAPSRAITTPRSSKSTTRFSRCPAIRRLSSSRDEKRRPPRLLAARQAFPHPRPGRSAPDQKPFPPLAGIAQEQARRPRDGQHLRSGPRAAAHRLHQP